MFTLFIIGFLVWLVGFVWWLKALGAGDTTCWYAIGTMWAGIAMEWIYILTG